MKNEKKWSMLKVALAALGLSALCVAGAVVFGVMMRPAQRPALDLRAEQTPARVERGRYLANSVFLCTHCHSKDDPTSYGGYPVPGTEGAGGDCFGREMGVPGTVCPANITPDPETGIGAWTDGEIVRAMREGVDRQGRGLFPVMPYDLFREIPDDDALAIVAYLRTLPPVRNAVPKPKLDFPVNVLSKLAPKPLAGPVAAIDRSDRMAYGHYLTRACFSCHTQVDANHQPIPSLAFGGGREFARNDLVVRSANLTFDETGLGGRTKEQFIALFSLWRGVPAPKVAPKDNTFMPWHSVSGMTDEDLGVVYDFLGAQPKVHNLVDRRPTRHAAATTAAATP